MTNPVVVLTMVAALATAATARGAQAPPSATPPARPKPAPASPTFFEGTVLGPDAKPVAEALIVLSSGDDFTESPMVARTDADGRFRVQPRRRAPHTIRIEARGLAAQTLEKKMPGVPLRVTLAKGGSIEGVVREASSGRPVAGARVEAREEGMRGAPAWEPGVGTVAGTTDARGAFRLDALARARHTVTAFSRAAGRATKPGVAVGQRVEMLLLDGPSISGRVLTPDGKPAAGAGVRAMPEIGFGPMPSAVADAAGRFDLPGLTPGVYRLIAFHKDWAIAIWGGVRVDHATDVDVDVVLAPPARVSGRLVDADENPVPGTLTLQELDGQALARFLGTLVRAEAGDDGRFTLERIPPGSHALAAGGRGMTSRRVEIEVGVRQKAVDIGDVGLERGAQIRGRVRDEAGSPIADAAVRGYPDGRLTATPLLLEGRTEADGSFVLGGANAPRYRLSVQAAGFAPVTQPVDAPGEGVEVVLEVAGTITGLVVDDAGNPVEALDVNAQPSGAADARIRQSPRTRSVVGEGGRFTLDDVAPGTYVVQVAGRDLGRQVVSGVKVASGAVTDLGRIRLAAGAAVRGTVLDASSNPVRAATVEARGSDRSFFTSGDFQHTTTDSAGGFHLRGLPTGTVIVIARHPEFAEGRSAPVEIEPGRTAETSVTLARGGRIEGVVRRRGGGMPPEAWIMVRSLSAVESFSAPPTVVPRSDGTFVIEHVAPGRVGVALMARGGAGGMGSGLYKEIDVREGETAPVELVWREILLTGKVTRGGAPLPGIRLTARGGTGGSFMGSGGGIPAPSSGPQRMTAVTREDGSYEMLVGEPGRIAMRAESTVERKAYPVRSIEVADVESQTVDLDFPASGISGVVVDAETEAPVARADVGAFRGNRPGGPGGGHTSTGADGRFTIDLDPGTFDLRAAAEGYGMESVEVTVGQTPGSDIRVALARGARLRGQVLDHRGRPAPGVWVMASEEGGEGVPAGSETSSLDGAFEFAALRPGRYSLAAGSALAGFGALNGVSPGAADVALRLAPGGRIVVSATEGDATPVADAWVNVRRVNGAPFHFPGAAGRTRSAGTVDVDSPAGEIEVEVNKDGLTGRGQVTVPAGGVAQLEVTLSAEAPPPAP